MGPIGKVGTFSDNKIYFIYKAGWKYVIYFILINHIQDQQSINYLFYWSVLQKYRAAHGKLIEITVSYYLPT